MIWELLFRMGTIRKWLLGKAKKWMAENSIVLATLIVNSLRTSNVLDVININILKTRIEWKQNLKRDKV